MTPADIIICGCSNTEFGSVISLLPAEEGSRKRKFLKAENSLVNEFGAMMGLDGVDTEPPTLISLP